MPIRCVIYLLSGYGSPTCLGHVSMLVMPFPFAKNKKIAYRLSVSCCSPFQYLLGGFNPRVWILQPPYLCFQALIHYLHALIALLNIFALYLISLERVNLVPHSVSSSYLTRLCCS